MAGGGMGTPIPTEPPGHLPGYIAERVRRDREERKQLTIEVFSALYDKQATYATLILAGGYAGFFAIWDHVRDSLTTMQTFLTALLISFSLVVFVFWQVYVMFRVSQQQVRLGEAANASAADFDTAMAAHRDAESKSHLLMAKLWPVAFWLCVIPAIVGAALFVGLIFTKILLPVHAAGVAPPVQELNLVCRPFIACA